MVPKIISVYVSILLSSLMYKNSHVTSSDLPRDIVGHLCPYTDFCHTNASQVLQNPKLVPCCSSCSCDDDCWETQRCCPDMVDVKTKTTNLVCKRTMVKKTTFLLGYTDDTGYTIPNYFITDTCPDTEKDEIIRKACAGEVVTSLQDIIWVSDIATGKIYQNSHCALCHNVKQWKNWNIRSSSCTAFLNATDDNLAQVLFSSDCTLLNEVPESEQFIVDKYRCFIPDIFSCNQTGLWQHYDAYIADKCQKYNGWFFEKGFLRVTIHKNPYCFICNKGDLTHETTRCAPPPSKPRGLSTPFNVLLELSEAKLAHRNDLDCARNEMWDKYMDRCRTLTCPFGSFSFNGKCKPLALEMNNLGIKIGFRLEGIDTDKIISVADNLTLLEQNGENFIASLWKALGLRRCSVCMTQLLTEKKDGMFQAIMDFFVQLEIQTSSGCQLNEVFEKLAKVQDKTIKVSLGANVNLKLSVHFEKDSHTDAVELFYQKNGQQCRILLKLTEIPCPEIELRYDEVTSYHDENVNVALASLFTNVRGLNDTGKARICVSDYLRVMSSVNGSPATDADVSRPLRLVAFILVFSAGARLQYS